MPPMGQDEARGVAAREETASAGSLGDARPWRLGFESFLVAYFAFLAVDWWGVRRAGSLDMLDIYAAVFWTLPLYVTVLGLYGGVRTAQRLRQSRPLRTAQAADRELLVVVVPTVGREDTLPALERSVRSMQRFLPRHFPQLRIDVVADEGCAIAAQLATLAAAGSGVRLLTVPADFRTPHASRFKARANEYANRLRVDEGEARPDVWVLHMDDDTGVGPDTSEELARFVDAQREAGSEALDLCQGVLCYPRELAPNRLVWLADAVRPACDVGLFAATTGSGSPRAGLHGELLLIRASIEADIGWDFGARSLVEDAQFALVFCSRHPGRSGWIPARSYGASPSTVADFTSQRERWVWGLLELVTGRNRLLAEAVPRRSRLLLLHNVLVWMCAPLAHPAVIVLICGLTGDLWTTPVVPFLVPLWALNLSFCIWLYWEGLKLNAAASADPRRRWWETVCVVVLIPLFSLWECVGIVRGVHRFATARDARFTVIAKPA
jgi:cellulose synthase/poly-beta-1,6-N-acetylglucosamine synthase-like glycosyltransferase